MVTVNENSDDEYMSNDESLPDLVPRDDSDSESESEEEPFLPWTTPQILTPIDSDSESEEEEEEEPHDQESYKIDEQDEDSKEINGAEILLTIPAVEDNLKKTILYLLDSGSSSSLLNDDVTIRNVTSKERCKEVWDIQKGTFTTSAKTILSNLQLSQFTTRRNFNTEMHLLEKKKDEKASTTYQIYVPRKLQVPPVEWYHKALKQPGKTRTRRYTIDQHYAWPEYANDNRKIGDQVTEGPYRFKRIFRNGTVTILRGAYEENISIRRLRPY